MLNIEELQYLVPKPKREILMLYVMFWKMGWQHFMSATKDTIVKQQEIKLLEKAIRCDFPVPENILARLQKTFVAENLSLYLLLDLLTAWRYLATDKQPTSEDQLSEIIGAAVSPLARIIMALNDEQPSTYLPMQALLSALLGYDLWLNKSSLTKKLHLSKRQKNNKLQGQLKSATVLLAIVRHRRLKWHLALFLNHAALYMRNNKQELPSRLDEVKIFLYSIYQFFTVRHRTVTRRGI